MKILVKIYDHHLGVDREFGMVELSELQDVVDHLKMWGIANELGDDLGVSDEFDYYGQFRLDSTGRAYFEYTTV